MTRSSSAGEMAREPSRSRGRGGTSVTCLATVSTTSAEANGRRPVVSS
ncbi:MAG TPA: hypothetical protein VFU21_08490 [Kofleriaceae bacterium]|nr:hypothetical protein [Kofleriaceae bacterium]